MLATIFSWIFITLVFYAFGDGFITLYTKFIRKKEIYSSFEIFIIGLCVIATLISITSIWLPSGLMIAAVLIILSLAYLLLARRKEILMKIKAGYKNISGLQIVFAVITLFLFLIYMVMHPSLADTFYYHIQNIMWNEQYHVVPGLANVQERFGFNSNFFLLASTFGFRPVFGQFIYGLNGLCMLLLFVQIIFDAKKKQPIVTLFSLLIYAMFFFMYKVHLGSLSTDLLPNMLVMYLLFSLFSDQENIKHKSLLFWLIPVFCITLKLSIIFICLLSLFVIISFLKEKSYRAAIAICLGSLCIIVPWLVRNVIISGYLIHPYPALDLFSFDWKLPMEYVIESKKYIEAYAISIDAMHIPSEQVLDYSFEMKVRKWIFAQRYIEMMLTAAALVSPLLMLFVCRSKKVIKENPVFIFMWLISLIGFVFWLCVAPGVRFGAAFMLILFFIPVYIFLKEKDYAYKPGIINIAMLLTLIFLGGVVVRYFQKYKSVNYSYTQLLYKPQSIRTLAESEPFVTETVHINNVTLTKALSIGCMDCELPCSNDYVNNIEMRGNSLQDGFRQKKKE